MSAPVWDTERAATLARKAYRYLARVYPYPTDAPLEPLNVHEDAALKAQAAGDFDAYEDALRAMMRTALEAKMERGRAA
jgi:hypothetical protein